MPRKLETVKGYKIPSPRLTKLGYWYGFLYLILPILVILGLLDVLLYIIFEYGFDVCYGIYCYLEP